MELRIKFVSSAHEPDLVLSVQPVDTIDTVIKEVVKSKRIPQDKRLRILCAGREFYAEDHVSKCPAKVLHCIVTDTESQRPHASPPKPELPTPPPSVVEQPPLDWLDVVDPGTVLIWIFGSILALLWLLFMFYANMFDRTSVVMLIMMTVAFLIPCVVSYLPWPTFLQPQAPAAAPSRPYETYDPATGRSSAVPPGAAWQRHPYDGDIPPRPPARIRPGS